MEKLEWEIELIEKLEWEVNEWAIKGGRSELDGGDFFWRENLKCLRDFFFERKFWMFERVLRD